MRTYQEALEASREGAPFSNGTEGYSWTESWCARCLRDAPFRNMDKGSGCPLVAVAMIAQRTPSEWLEQPWGERGPSLTDRYHCIEFRPFGGGGGGGEPRPKPEPPDMDGLFPRPERAVRMLKQITTKESVNA